MATISFSRRAILAGATALALMGAVLPLQRASAQGDLLIAPTRVILDGRRGTEVILSNIGSQEATYRVDLELRRMSSDGQLSDVDVAKADPTEQAALDMIRFAPRRVVLPPGQPQAIRIAARAPAGLPDGEYRAHMTFRAIPKPRPAETADGAQGVTIALVPVYAISIPIIVRLGNISAQVMLDHAGIANRPDGKYFELVLNRSGKASTFGQLRVFAKGSDKPILKVAGVAVYPEITKRLFSQRLSDEQAAALHGPVHIEYSEMPEDGGKPIAELDTTLD
ncbi:MAG: molecular chaperone [Sphingomonadaceae bacterium]